MSIYPNSKVQYTLYHYTDRETAEKIKKTGFKSGASLNKFCNNKFNGIYFTNSTQNYWEGADLVPIAVKVNMENPMDFSFFYSEEGKYTKEQQDLLNQFMQFQQMAEDNIDKKYTPDKPYNIQLATELTNIIRNAGYDGFIAAPSDNFPGHIEHIVFNPQNIHIINDKTEQLGKATKTLQKNLSDIKSSSYQNALLQQSSYDHE